MAVVRPISMAGKSREMDKAVCVPSKNGQDGLVNSNISFHVNGFASLMKVSVGSDH